MTDPRAQIDRLGLAPHPEGDWYRETWRGPPGADGRASGTAIHFLLEAEQRSHWQAAHAARGWALVSCLVVPGFDFAGFTLPDWSPRRLNPL